MHKLGISVYPDKSPKEEVYAYMEKALSWDIAEFLHVSYLFLKIKEKLIWLNLRNL